MTIHENIKSSEHLIYSDSEILVVLDHDPITKGHILILPQKSYLDIDEVPTLTIVKIFIVAQTYIKVLKSKYSANGYSIMQNGGIFNEIDVFHLHVFPRFKDAEFGYKKVYTDNDNDNDIQELRKLFRAELKKSE